MLARSGGGTAVIGEYPITIIGVSTAEIRLLVDFASQAVQHMPQKPTLIQPLDGSEIILSYTKPITPADALRQFKKALADCKAES